VTASSRPGPLLVGLGGGIGSGKSTVARLMAAHGALHLDTDRIYHDLLEQDPSLREAISARFGAAAIDPKGGVDRHALRDALRQEPARFAELDALTHPRVWAEVEARSRRADAATSLILVEVPLLFESGFDQRMDQTIYVRAPLEARYARVVARSGLPRRDFDAIVRRQLPVEDAASRADHVIENDGPLETLEERVDTLLALL
jgi:dephospho-CoA kinase